MVKNFVSSQFHGDVHNSVVESTEQTCGSTDQNRKKCAQHHIQGEKDKQKASIITVGEVKWSCLGSAQIRPMDFASHHIIVQQK